MTNRFLDRALVSFCLILSAIGGAARGAEPPEVLSPAAIDSLALPYIESETVGGMTIGLFHRGESLVRGYGKLSRNGESTSDGRTVYEIGSITKVMTGILLADAVGRGELRLDQPIAELLPEGVTLRQRPDTPAITLLHLSTHTAGLPRLPGNMRPADPGNPYADYTAEKMYEFLGNYRVWRKPGSRSEYSNLAVGLLGDLLARKAGTSYEQLVSDRLTRPLKMTDTSIELTSSQRERLAPPHGAGGEVVSNWDIPGLAGAGALRSTTDDMLKFIVATIDPPEGELGAAIDLAWQQHQASLPGNHFAMGLGWHIAGDGETRFHSGQTGGYHSSLFVSRHFESGVVVLTNTATGEIDRLAEDLLRHLAGAKVAPRRMEKAIEVPSEVVERYAGRYELVPGFVLTVTARDGGLYVQATGQPEARVFPRSETEWYYKVVNAQLTFKVDDQGRTTEVELFQNGVRRRAPRMESSDSGQAD
jgi:D-alanyl-D-alanine-carboxypeptidase/D-alanyl-D-alanine-endopeptidase